MIGGVLIGGRPIGAAPFPSTAGGGGGTPSVWATPRFAGYRVEVAWSSSLPGVAVLDSSLLGSGDLLGSGQIAYTLQQFGGPYDDITRRTDNHVRVEEIRYTRGRSDDMSQMQALSATITGRDPTGMMNVHNPASPLNAGILSQGALKPLRPVRVTAIKRDGTERPILVGFLRSLDYKPEGRTGTFTLEVTDLFAMLETPRKDQPGGGPQPVIAYTTTAPGGGTLTTGAAIGMILDFVGWTDPTLRQLDAGDTLPFFEAVGDKSALALIAELVGANLGFFYINPAGVAVFRDRSNRFAAPVKAGIVNNMRAIGSGFTLDTIKNKWTVTRMTRTGVGQYSASTPQVASDFSSAHDYGEREDELSSPWILTDSVAAGLAGQLVGATKDPTNPVWSLDISNRTADLLDAVLGIDLIDRISVIEAETGTAGIFFVEQVSGTITAEGHVHSCQYILSDRSAVAGASLDPFILGTDLLDGVKVLAF